MYMYSRSAIGFQQQQQRQYCSMESQVLQECFEKNAYPKDDELEALSRLLDLSPRVIVVWFQNARQKVRKSYENQATSTHAPPRPPVPMEAAASVDVGPSAVADGGPALRAAAAIVNGGEPEYRCDRCPSTFGRLAELAAHRCGGADEDGDPGSAAAADRAGPGCGGGDGDGDGVESDESRDDDGAPSENDASESSVGSEPPASGAPAAAEPQHRHHHHHHHPPPPASSSSSSFPSLADWSHPAATSGHVTPTTPTDDAATRSEAAADECGAAPRQLWMPDDGVGDPTGGIGIGIGGAGSGNGSGGDKRMRTTILPEQLDYLYHKYQADCNPSRKQLDAIAAHVGLKKRVVQVRSYHRRYY